MPNPPVAVALKRLDPELPAPVYARRGDAGVDLRARTDATVPARGGRVMVPTGVAVAIPEGWAGLVMPRSGLALRHGVTLANSPGVIDSGYRDEVAVVLANTDPHDDYHLRRGDRIAQLVLVEIGEIRWEEVAELPDSERGAGGFGHSGR